VNAVAQIRENRSLRVLCIDDEPQIQQLLTDCLASFKHQVTVASGGRQGMELFREAKRRNQPYEVVVTDLGMPDMDGTQVTRTIKAESPGTPVIMMTGWGTMMKEDGEAAPQVDALIGKPPNIAELNNLLLHITSSDKQ
jgi:CheY-like chemotaxis protein